jgi:hypothetical protein
MSEKVEMVEPDAIDRCQSVHGKGQCRYRRVHGTEYCPMHGGNKGQASAALEVKRQYQLAKWQSTVDGFADDDQVKSLRGEIGITRMVMQETITKCKDGGELLLYSAKIGELVSKIERLVVSCHRMESSLGLLLDKGKVMSLATMMVEIISKHVKDDDAIAAISNEIVTCIVNTQGKLENGNRSSG